MYIFPDLNHPLEKPNASDVYSTHNENVTKYYIKTVFISIHLLFVPYMQWFAFCLYMN